MGQSPEKTSTAPLQCYVEECGDRLRLRAVVFWATRGVELGLSRAASARTPLFEQGVSSVLSVPLLGRFHAERTMLVGEVDS